MKFPQAVLRMKPYYRIVHLFADTTYKLRISHRVESHMYRVQYTKS